MISKLTKKEFMERKDFYFVVNIEEALRRKPDAIGVVLFENKMGAMTVRIIGPTNTYKSAEDCEGKYLNDMPSHDNTPVAWVPREEFLP